MATGVRVHGLEQAVQSLDQFVEAVEAAGELVGEALEPAASEARARAPRLSGELIASIRVDVAAGSASVVSDLVYSGVQNYGWPEHNIAASLFLEVDADKTAELVDDELQRLADQLGL
jgi:hypothetical protein